MASHQGDQAAILGTDGVDLPPTGQEVVVDEADDMKPVGDDDRFGKVLLSDRTIDYSQVHAHDPDVLFAFELKQIGLQGGFRAAESDVIDAMVLQIAEGGGVAFLAREEVFVDAQDPRANE